MVSTCNDYYYFFFFAFVFSSISQGNISKWTQIDHMHVNSLSDLRVRCGCGLFFVAVCSWLKNKLHNYKKTKVILAALFFPVCFLLSCLLWFGKICQRLRHWLMIIDSFCSTCPPSLFAVGQVSLLVKSQFWSVFFFKYYIYVFFNTVLQDKCNT